MNKDKKFYLNLPLTDFEKKKKVKERKCKREKLVLSHSID